MKTSKEALGLTGKILYFGTGLWSLFCLMFFVIIFIFNYSEAVWVMQVLAVLFGLAIITAGLTFVHVVALLIIAIILWIFGK